MKKRKKKLEEYELELKELQDLKYLDGSKKVKEELDKIERERELNKDYIEQKIENERQFYEQLADEISSNPSYFTDDDPYDLKETPENREKGILKPEEEIYTDEDD